MSLFEHVIRKPTMEVSTVRLNSPIPLKTRMCSSLLNDYLTKLKAEKSNTAPPNESGNDFSTKSALPRLKIRSFSGAFEDWPSFRNIFLSIVGNNPYLKRGKVPSALCAGLHRA